MGYAGIMDMKELIVVHGMDIVAMARVAAESARLETLIPPGAMVSFKPNLVVAKAPSSGAVTHPELIEGLVSYLREKGFSKFEIIEGSWVGDSTPRAFEAAGYSALSARLGIPLVDLQRDSWKQYDAGGGLKIALCDRATAARFLVNLPVLKGHCQTTVTCALKNLKGCIPDDEKSRFHSLGLHEPIARLNCVLKAGFILVDAVCGDLDFEEGGNPVPMNRLIAGRDPVLIDAYACRLMGHATEDVPYIGLAQEYGVGSADLSTARIMELGDTASAPAVPPRSGRLKALAGRTEESEACSACYAALIHGLARLEEHGLLKRFDAALAKHGAERGGDRIAVGRGFRGVTRRGLGCGNCASGAGSFVPGCPPDGAAVTAFLEKVATGR
jgi:uncharacterized protein (DUF362 family)